jgi:hypothetical protein
MCRVLLGVVKRCQRDAFEQYRPGHAPQHLGRFFGSIAISRPRDGNMTETGIRVAQPVPSRPNSSVFYFTPRVNSEGPQKTTGD